MNRQWEGDSGWGTRVHPWWIHVDVWQNQYNIVKLNKIKFKKMQIKTTMRYHLTLVRMATIEKSIKDAC